MVLLLFQSLLATNFHSLMRTEVNTCQTLGAMSMHNGLALLYGDIVIGAYLGAEAASHTLVSIDFLLHGVGGEGEESAAVDKGADESVPSMLQTMRLSIDIIGDGLYLLIHAVEFV